MREPVIDLIKAVACLVILLHHLSAYGPLANSAWSQFPVLTEWFYDYGRMAVQVFLVTSGFLVAKRIAPDGILKGAPLQAVVHRYIRLTVPYFSALILAILCAAFARSWMDDDFIPSSPTPQQIISHIFLLQDLMQMEALSAGVWYIAIDFQLFSFTVLLLWLVNKSDPPSIRTGLLGKIVLFGVTMASLFLFNRDSTWDNTALYFFGSYGIGMIGYWTVNSEHKPLWLGSLMGVILVALVLEFRYRIAIAGLLALVLVLACHTKGRFEWKRLQGLSFLGHISYSLFLTHFPVLLVGNAVFPVFFSSNGVANLLGISLTLSLCIGVAILFYYAIEKKSFSYKRQLVFPTGLLATGLLLADV